MTLADLIRQLERLKRESDVIGVDESEIQVVLMTHLGDYGPITQCVLDQIPIDGMLQWAVVLDE